MGLKRRLMKLKEEAEHCGLAFQPALMAKTITERTGRWDLHLPEEIEALYAVCDGGEMDISVRLMPLSSYIEVRKMLIEIANEMDLEEWKREYHPFADLSGDLVLCLELPSRKIYVLDIECSVINEVAPSVEAFVSAIEAALADGGITEGEYGSAYLPGWKVAADKHGIREVWNSGIDEAKS